MSEADRAEPGALLRRVAGRARSRQEALQEFEEGVEAMKRRIERVLWPFFVPEAKDVFRWKVQLDCGCVHEVFTRGEDRYPDESRDRDPITQRSLRAGERWCFNDHGNEARVYRDIVDWVESRVREFPPDPEESSYEGLEAETWATIRHAEPHSSAFWLVRLSCGHYYDQVVTDVDWRPADGPRLVTEERAVEMRYELEDLWSAEGDTGWPAEAAERDHFRRMLDLRWPRPEPEQECRACRLARRITGYQRIGWLVPRVKPTALPSPNVERKRIEGRLARAEAEVRRRRDQLGLDDAE